VAKKFASLMTEKGKALIADAIAGGKTISLKYFAVGDGNGSEVTPSSNQTTLVNEVARVEINSIKETDPTGQIVAVEGIIPADKGGFWLREAGIFTSDGVLVAVSQVPVTYKPSASEGASSSQIVRMLLAVSNVSAVNLTIDDSIVIATEEFVNNSLKAHEKSRNHPDGTLTDKGFVQLSSATDSDDEKKAATPKAVKAANDNAETRLKASQNLSDLTNANKAREALALDKVGNWMAVQANGGTHSDGNHHLYIDWDGKIHFTVDSTYVGEAFTTQNPPTPEQSNSYPKTGGEVDGEVWSEVGNNYRLVAGNRGAFWRFDGNDHYLMFTNDGDPHGGYNNLRPLIADFATGKLSTGHDFTVGGTLYAGAGACWMATDGNIYGSLWGGYLNNWISGQIAAQINAAVAGMVTGHRYASSVWVGTGSSDWAAPSGTVVTGVGIYTGAKARYSYSQICVGGQWYNVETVS